MNQEFTPLEELKSALHYWWLIVVFMVVGASVGWVIQGVKAPLYEAEASITTSIEFTRTGQMTDIEEDYAIRIVGDVLFSERALEAVEERAGSAGLTLDRQTLLQMTTFERQNNTWIYRVRHADPRTAVQVSTWLAEAGYLAVGEALSEALSAESLARYADSLVSCLEQSVVTSPVQADCRPENLTAIQAELDATIAALTHHRLASQGILPAMVFSAPAAVVIPSEPVLFGRNLLMLGGALAGFLLAVWAISLRLPQRLDGGRRG